MGHFYGRARGPRSTRSGPQLPTFSPPQPSEPIQGASHSHPRPLHHMRVNLRRGHVGMAEQVLHRPDIGALIQQVGGEAVPVMPSSA